MTITAALVVHVGAAAVGILSGAAALSVRKGERLHRVSGTVFVLAMLTMAATAAYLAALIPDRARVIGGIFAFYFVASAWVTVRRRDGSIGLYEYGALAVALACAALAVIFGLQAAGSSTGTLDHYPAFIYFVLAGVVALPAALDLKVILAGGISGKPRIARHLWRMCAALFLATGSFFLGQQKIMPAYMHGSPVLLGLAIAPLVLMAFWLIRVRLTSRFKSAAVAS